jgi:NADPH-dependent 2,4-dienoyl-CoA reductase/sulfur reductase-like enzyme
MPMTFDLIVIGAGPAGCAAAIAAARHSLRVALIDEATKPGGQVYRAPFDGSQRTNRDADAMAGSLLRERITQTPFGWFPGRRVWSVARGFRVDAVSESGPESFSAPQLVAATGAYERVVPFPGWTLPGVIGLGAATILEKSQGMIPGRRCVIAGCGPLLFAIAAKVAAAGGNVVAAVDLAGPSDWLSALPGLTIRPSLLARGLGWVLQIRRAGIPVYFRNTVIAAEGDERIRRVAISPVDRNGATVSGATKEFGVDTLVVGHGLVPGSDIPGILRARLDYDQLRGGFVPAVDVFGRTTVPNLFAAGDGAGIRGAEAALVSGEIAGLTAAQNAGQLTEDKHERLVRPLLRRLRRHRPFADAVARQLALRPAQVASIPRDTVVCRCEDVTRAVIESAAAAGALDVNQMKHFTRCGMGPCQGRMCGDVAAEILAQSRKVPRHGVGYWTGRPPLRPISLADLVGTFDYSDIPIPAPAPL